VETYLPRVEAFQRYHQLYCTVVRRRGGDPNIGPRLPILLSDGGFESVELTVVQPIGTVGEVKLISPLTLENIADAVLEDGLATPRGDRRAGSGAVRVRRESAQPSPGCRASFRRGADGR